MIAFADDPRRVAMARSMRLQGRTIDEILRVVGGGRDAVRAAVVDVVNPNDRRYPQHIRDEAIAAYGKRSMTLVAEDLGVSPGAVSHWWAKAKRDGLVEPIFGRWGGAAVRAGRISRHPRNCGEVRVEPALSVHVQRGRERRARVPSVDGRA